MKTKKLLAILAAAALMFTFASCSKKSTEAAAAKKTKITLNIGAGHTTDGTYWSYGAWAFFEPAVKERVAAETNYEIEWIENYGGSVAALGEVLEAVEAGTLDVGVVVFPFEPAKLMVHGMTYRMPFQCPDPVVVSKVAQEMFAEYPVFIEQIEKYNQKYLGVLVSDDYSLYSNYPIKTVNDLKGHKIAGAGANLKWIQGTGAIGVQSNLNDGYTSLQTGVYEGFINPTVAQYNYKIHEVGRHLLLANFGAQVTACITVNKQTWDSLPPEVQKIFIEEGKNTSAKEAQYAKDDFDKTVGKLADSNEVYITQLPDPEKTRWANAIPNIVKDDLCAELDKSGIDGTGIVKAFYNKLNAAGYPSIRDWFK